nr:gamma-glutamylcyclotransferase family protein [uncultured Lacibacter sp.]
MNDANQLLFVYGSLRSGFQGSAFQYIAPYFTKLADGKVKGKLYDLGEFPAALPSNDEAFIIGELYQANSTEEFNWAITQLDDYEGVHPEEGEEQLYERAKATVFTDKGEFAAWIYWYKLDVTDKPVIESGDVLEYQRQKLK